MRTRAWLWRQQPAGTTLRPSIHIDAIPGTDVPVPNWADELDVAEAGRLLEAAGWRLVEAAGWLLVDLGTSAGQRVEFTVESIHAPSAASEEDRLRGIIIEALEAAQQVHIHAHAGEGARTKKLITILRRGISHG